MSKVFMLLQGPRKEERDAYLARRAGKGDLTCSEFLHKYYIITWLEEMENEPADDEEFLEEVFRRFNIEHPATFDSYSMSVGDIVDVCGRIYWCAPVGFERIN